MCAHTQAQTYTQTHILIPHGLRSTKTYFTRTHTHKDTRTRWQPPTHPPTHTNTQMHTHLMAENCGELSLRVLSTESIGVSVAQCTRREFDANFSRLGRIHLWSNEQLLYLYKQALIRREYWNGRVQPVKRCMWRCVEHYTSSIATMRYSMSDAFTESLPACWGMWACKHVCGCVFVCTAYSPDIKYACGNDYVLIVTKHTIPSCKYDTFAKEPHWEGAQGCHMREQSPFMMAW